MALDFCFDMIEFTRQVIMASWGSKMKKLNMVKGKVRSKLNVIKNRFSKLRRK